MLTPLQQTARLIEILRQPEPRIPLYPFGGAPLPDAPEPMGCESIVTGNADLAASSTWAPPVHAPERPPICWPLAPEIDR